MECGNTQNCKRGCGGRGAAVLKNKGEIIKTKRGQYIHIL
jgi:hypothetical protein